MAQAQVGERRDGPTAAIGRIRQVCADLPAHRGLLLGDPTTATWLIRTALAAGDNELAASAARTAEALASDNPGFAPITAAVAHSMGLVGQDPAHLAEAAAQHHDPWAKASAAEDLGVLHARQGDRDRAVHHLEEALGGYQLTGATADMARIRRRLRKLGVRRRLRTQSADRPVSGWQSLTDAERAASELVAQGLSNRQAAEPHVYQFPHRGLLHAPGIPQAQYQFTRRTHPHRHAAISATHYRQPDARNCAATAFPGNTPIIKQQVPSSPGTPPSRSDRPRRRVAGRLSPSACAKFRSGANARTSTSGESSCRPEARPDNES